MSKCLVFSHGWEDYYGKGWWDLNEYYWFGFIPGLGNGEVWGVSIGPQSIATAFSAASITAEKYPLGEGAPLLEDNKADNDEDRDEFPDTSGNAYDSPNFGEINHDGWLASNTYL